MSNYKRTDGIMHNLEPTLLNRTLAEQIDDYQMKIYELVKSAFPDRTGYIAYCYEEQTEDGETHVKTTFKLLRNEEE